MLDDDGGGLLEFRGEAAGGFEIDEIVVGELFALELFCGGEACDFASCGDVEARRLDADFRRSASLLELQRDVDAFGEQGASVRLDVACRSADNRSSSVVIIPS